MVELWGSNEGGEDGKLLTWVDGGAVVIRGADDTD